MIPILSLWLPIVLSAVAVFLVSSLVHMVLKYHQKDYSALPGEPEVLEAMRRQKVPPGQYSFPHCASMKEMGSPEMVAKYEKGPVGLLTVLPDGPPAMGKALGLWFAFCLAVGVFVAYLAGRFVAPGMEYLEVFRFTGTVAFMAYGVGEITNSIWRGQRWSTTWKSLFDGLLYSLVTAGCFAWLWPG